MLLKSVVKFGDAKLISSSIYVLHNKMNRNTDEIILLYKIHNNTVEIV